MTDLSHLEENHPNFWRRVARIAFPIARKLLRVAIGENKSTPLVQSIGPIEYLEKDKIYHNTSTERIALFFTSVDNRGHVLENKIDRIIFEAKGRKSQNEISVLVNNNLAGDLSWSIVNDNLKNGESNKVFVDLSHWNGSEITLFDLDDIKANDLHVKMGLFDGVMCMTASNNTIRYSYTLEVVLIDASGNVANFDITIPSGSGSQTVSMGKDFNPNLPVRRAFFIGRATAANA